MLSDNINRLVAMALEGLFLYETLDKRLWEFIDQLSSMLYRRVGSPCFISNCSLRGIHVNASP